MVLVDNVTSLSRNGLRDWLIQRVSAVVIAIYSIALIIHVVTADHLSYQFWHDFFHLNVIRILSFIVLLSLVFHAWVGMWTIYTDYIKPTFLRLLLQCFTILSLMALLAWGVLTLGLAR